MSNSIQLAVVGATGLVGQAVLELLAQRQLPVGRVCRGCGGQGRRNRRLWQSGAGRASDRRLCLRKRGLGHLRRRRRLAAVRAAGTRPAAVVDFSSAFRADDSVPLVIPAINGALLADAGEAALVSVPNCTVTPLALALAAAPSMGLRVSVATYQSVSGGGQAAMEELADQTTALFSQRETEPGLR